MTNSCEVPKVEVHDVILLYDSVLFDVISMLFTLCIANVIRMLQLPFWGTFPFTAHFIVEIFALLQKHMHDYFVSNFAVFV